MSVCRTTRGERRHHNRRIFQKRVKQSKQWSRAFNEDAWRLKFAQLGVHTGARCSCHYCVSPRKLYGNSDKGLTFNELRQMARLNDEE